MIAPFAPNHQLLVVSCIKIPYDLAVICIESEVRSLIKGEWDKKNGQFTFQESFKIRPECGAAHKRSVLVLSADSGNHTFLTANLEDGWSSLAFRVSKLMKAKALILGFCDDEMDYPARFFTFFDSGKTLRHVSVRKEEKWIFYQQGSIVDGESMSDYLNRVICKRLTNQNLINIAKSNGFLDLESMIELKVTGKSFRKL